MNTRELRSVFIRYTFFNILSSLGVSFYILIDTFFISLGMGATGLAALNLCLPVFNFINGFGLMLGMGGGSKFSMLYCRTEREETDKIFTNAFCAAVGIGAVFLLAGVFFSEELTILLGADSTVFAEAHSYLKTVLLFSPAFILNNLLICFMRNDAAPRLAMAGVLGSSFANIILDSLFIFVLEWGMQGAALATCLSPLISMAIMGIHFVTGWNAFRLRIVRPSLKIIRNIVSLGMHTFVTECSGGIVIIVFNFVIYRLCGNTGIAAYGVIANLAIVFTAIFTGLSSGVQPLFCKYHGSCESGAMKYLLRLATHTSLILALIAYVIVCKYTPELVAVFNGKNDMELAEIAQSGIGLYFLFMPFMGINAVLSVFFTSCEKPLPSQIFSLMRGVILVIPVAFIFYGLRSVIGIWLTVPIAEGVTAVTAVIVFICTKSTVHHKVGQYFPQQNTQQIRQ
ncbi:MAG: MATE family efflux transporter [Oscillospiraceae bacterium]|nr:MATE family efflux transporter [Oscillospiraceae bacterium]